MADDLRHLGITDLDEKHTVICRPLNGPGPSFALLWRTTGPKGKPTPHVGARLRMPGRIDVVVERIDPPGTTPDLSGATLIITPYAPAKH